VRKYNVQDIYDVSTTKWPLRNPLASLSVYALNFVTKHMTPTLSFAV
jgi:hypothetical protein